MHIVQLKGIADFLNQPMWDSENMIYRGVRSAAHELLTSIGRLPSKTSEELMTFEEQLHTEFKRRARPYVQNIPASDLEWLFLAQHYGVPTRLLDWTTSPLVALFFAAQGDAENDFAVYRTLHSHWLVPNSNCDPFSMDQVLGVRPPHFDHRFVNQEGVFTIHPDPRLAYDNESITKYIFSVSAREDIKWNLRKLGISNARLFPGLDGVARDVIDISKYHLSGSSIRGSAGGL